MASAIIAYDLELRGRAKPGTALADGLSTIQDALKGASDALKTGDVDRGWKCFHNAQRLELLHLDEAQLHAAAIGIRNEADKLDGWRKAAVVQLLDNDRDKLGPERIFQAARIRDEHYDNEAYKDRLRHSNRLRFAVVLSLVVAVLLGWSWLGYLPQANPPNQTAALPQASPSNQAAMLLSMALFGLLGAAISATIATGQRYSSSRIPEMISSGRVMTLRLLIGPASAIVLYFLAQSEIYKKVFTFGASDNELLIVAVAAGFSERLVLRVVETITGKD